MLLHWQVRTPYITLRLECSCINDLVHNSFELITVVSNVLKSLKRWKDINVNVYVKEIEWGQYGLYLAISELEKLRRWQEEQMRGVAARVMRAGTGTGGREPELCLRHTSARTIYCY